ncbi:MAG: glycoside hydrolase family 10 protein, partial [Oscillospiraceae bacterium]
EIMVEEAHKRDLSFQAWINPLRGCEAKDVSRQNGYKMGEWISGGKRVVNVNGTYYFNPAYDEVVKLISDGAREIVANYDVDGLHIDDYFYPTTDASFDSAAFKASGYTKLSDFRFANCDKMVKSLYNAVKASNSSAIFGVSCQGNLQNNYIAMYADVKKWCSNSGYIDYIMPQIYFGFDNATQPFAECVNTWNNLAASGKIPLIVGVAVSKIGHSDSWAGTGKNEWITDKDILKRQFLESAEQSEYGGIVLYRYFSIFAPSADVKAQVDEEISSLKAVLKQ